MRYLTLAESLVIAEAVTGLDVVTLATGSRLELLDSGVGLDRDVIGRLPKVGGASVAHRTGAWGSVARNVVAELIEIVVSVAHTQLKPVRGADRAQNLIAL